jgi:hypothetical protein
MPTSSKLAHLSRVRQEGAEEEQRRSLQDRSDINDLSAHLFALTVTDNGPSDLNHPNKLWTSRAEFQASSQILHPSTPAIYPSLDDITDSVQHLALLDDLSQQDASASTTDCGPRNTRESKRESHKASVDAHSTLNIITSKAATCKHSLSLPPSQERLQSAEAELRCLRLSLESVSRDVPTVTARKEAIRRTLDTLDGRLIELRYLVPRVDEGPFAYKSGQPFLSISPSSTYEYLSVRPSL